MGQLVDVAKELERIGKELEAQRKFLSSLEAKLSNEKFVSRAPEAVVNAEREKAQKTKDLIAQLEESEAATEAHYLIREGVKSENLKVYVGSLEIPWHEAEGIIDGSYLIFSVKNGENMIVVTENKEAVSLWGVVALVVLVVFVIAIVLEKNQRT